MSGPLAAPLVVLVMLLLVADALLGGAGATASTAAAVASAGGPLGAWDALALGCVSRPAPLPPPAITEATYRGTGRLRTYLLRSALQGTTPVNVELPEHFDASGRTRYPVLYLLHGSQGSYADWAGTNRVNGVATGGNAESLVGSRPVIVVMPDDGPAGSYSDWYGLSRLDVVAGALAGLLTQAPVATPAWETFDIEGLIPWVDATFPTQPGPEGRAIAGVSSGGAGAVKYAAAHPGLFGFVGSFSGALDTDLADAATNWYADAQITDQAGPPDAHCTFGDPTPDAGPGQRYYWEDNDPTALAPNLAGTALWIASGNGTPGPLDPAMDPGQAAIDATLEAVVDDMSQHFAAAVRAAGLGGTMTTDFYGNGLHDWDCWQADLTAFLAWLSPRLGVPRPAPTGFSFRTARATSSAWGWSFRHDSGLTVPNVNTTGGFVYLTGVSAQGFTAAGHGTLGVQTPAHAYLPGSVHTVTAGTSRQRIAATGAGALSFRVTLGPTATGVQTEFPASGPPPGTPQVAVTIR